MKSRARSRGVAAAMIAIVTIAIASSARAGAATITGASIASSDRTVELHFKVHGRGLHWRLSVYKQELWIDLGRATLDLPERPIEGRELPPVKGVRVVSGNDGRAHIVVEVSGKVDYAIARLPNELVIRLAASGSVPDLGAPLLAEMERTRPASRVVSPPRHYSRRRFSPALARNGRARAVVPPAASNAGAQVAMTDPVRPVVITPPRPASGRPLVVIDPGHGGRDPGTSAADGTQEKTVALAIARQLQIALETRGVNAELTRGDDTFLSLAERTRLANRVRADLFISIHLNSNPDTSTTGIEAYYLNNTTDRATIRLARMENGVAGGYGAPGQPNLHYILSDLRQGYKANESASLARMIEDATAASIDAGMRLRVNELGAKKGPFYVLVGAEMPSVLVECGFLSNPGEARLLEQSPYQRAVAAGIAEAVVHYFNADAAVGNL